MDGLSGVLVTASSVKAPGFLSSLPEETINASSFFGCGRLLEGLISLLLSAIASLFLGATISIGTFISCTASFGSTVLLFFCSIVLLFTCSTVLLFNCSTVLLFNCSIVPLFPCSNVPLFPCSIVPLFLTATGGVVFEDCFVNRSTELKIIPRMSTAAAILHHIAGILLSVRR